jgi:hypothetical protein
VAEPHGAWRGWMEKRAGPGGLALLGGLAFAVAWGLGGLGSEPVCLAGGVLAVGLGTGVAEPHGAWCCEGRSYFGWMALLWVDGSTLGGWVA